MDRRSATTTHLLLATGLALTVCAGCRAFPPLADDSSANQQQGVRGDQDPPHPPTGYKEITGPLAAEGGWDNPEAPLVQFVNQMPLPARLIPIEANERQFVLFDDAGVMVLTLKYNVAENKFYCDKGSDNPFFSRIPQRIEGAWECVFEQEQPSEPVSSRLVFRLTIPDAVGGSGPTLAIQLSFTVIAVQEIPADPQAGRDLIPAGSTATWLRSETYSLLPSPSPFALFPDAAFEFVESEE